MSPTYLTINDKDLTTEYGFSVIEPRHFLSGPRFTFPRTPIAGRLGAFLDSGVTGEWAPFTVRGEFSPTTLADRLAKLDKMQRDLAGEVEIVTTEDTGRRWRGYLDNSASEVWDAARAWYLLPFKADLSFTLVAREDIEGTSVALTTTARQVPLGTASSGGLVTIMGAATNPVLTYADAGGNTVQTMTFTITLAASNDFLEVDLDKQTILKSVSGTRTTDNSIPTAGKFFSLDPADAAPAGPVWPSLKLSAGTGLIAYRRRWLT